jgi:hypothetical protein
MVRVVVIAAAQLSAERVTGSMLEPESLPAVFAGAEKCSPAARRRKSAGTLPKLAESCLLVHLEIRLSDPHSIISRPRLIAPARNKNSSAKT